jgi:hypothetical protein
MVEIVSQILLEIVLKYYTATSNHLYLESSLLAGSSGRQARLSLIQNPYLSWTVPVTVSGIQLISTSYLLSYNAPHTKDWTLSMYIITS